MKLITMVHGNQGGYDGLMPCGRKDCSECETCEYDVSLDTQLNKAKNMRIYSMLPVGENPSTSQIIIPGAVSRHNVAPLGATQLSLPFKNEDDIAKESPYCNLCKHFLKIQRPNKTTYNTRCSAETPRPGGSERVVKLNVYFDEKVEKPFWCPLIKEAIVKPLQNGIKIGGRTIQLPNNTTAMSDEQFKSWQIAKAEREMKEKWLAAPGITSWGEINENQIYHFPPSLKKNRMTIRIIHKYVGSIQAEDLQTKKNVWFYKDDEEYKFMSLVK